MKRLQSLCLALAAVAAAALAGCASPPDRYYTLTAVGIDTPASLRPAGAPLVIELAPLALPERLARPQMLVRQAGDAPSAEVGVLEQHRWASSFENELRDALASGVAARLGAIDATRSGGQTGGQPAWRVAVQVQRFDAVENAKVDVALSWSIRRSDAPVAAVVSTSAATSPMTVVPTTPADARCQWASTEPVGNGIDAVAQGAQRVTARAAEAIARQIGAMASRGQGTDLPAGCTG